MHGAHAPAARSSEYALRGCVGLIAAGDDAVSEAEARLLLGDDVGVLCVRLPRPSAARAAADPLSGVAAAVEQLAELPVEVAGLAATMPAYEAGEQRSAQLLAALSAWRGFPIVAATAALAHALELLQVRRVALLTSAPDAIAVRLPAFWKALGFKVIDVGRPGTEGRHPGGLPSTTSVLASARRVGEQNADAIVIADCGMPSLGTIAALSASGRAPVLSASLCLAWCVERALAGRPADARSLAGWLAEGAGWRARLDRLRAAASSA